MPLEPNTSQGFDHGDVLWLSPTEWLMVRRDERAPLLDERWWLDQTSGYAALEVSGAEAPELIAAGCSVDVHPRSFPPRRCAQTLFAKTSIVLFCVDGAPTYRLTVRRSHAAHLWRWIALNLELL